jgi:hypothetical protein
VVHSVFNAQFAAPNLPEHFGDFFSGQGKPFVGGCSAGLPVPMFFIGMTGGDSSCTISALIERRYSPEA